MTVDAHHSTVQLSGIVLQLRDDLTVEMREYGGKPVYIFEDELNSRFYRVGLAEYTFLSMLNGRTTFADALGRTASVMKQDALNEQEAAGLCRWVVESQLASTAASGTSQRLFELTEDAVWKARKSQLNPMYQKLPLFNPNNAMGILNATFGWFFSRQFAVFWMIVVAAGLWSVATDWARFSATQIQVVSQGNWIWLVLTWLGLRVVHEAAHGIACRRYGGHVREAGIMLILFAPMPYVDVTSIWRLDSKWKRMVVSAAGMYLELFIMGLACLVWSQTQSPLVQQNAMNVILSAGLTTVLFNANPLMRFDGYHILADYLEMPNLATHGQQSFHQFCRHWALGLPTSKTEWPEGRDKLVFVYGVGAFVWRIVIAVGIILSADTLYYGAGIVMAVLAIVVGMVLPAYKLIKFIAVGTETEQPDRAHFALVCCLGLMLIGGTLAFAPWYAKVRAPALVDYYPLAEVRTPVGGFVEQVLVENGQSVAAGDLLIVLSNRDLHSQAVEVETQRQQSIQRALAYRNNEEIAAWQAETENTRSLEIRSKQLEEKLAALNVVAPTAGVVIHGELNSLQGNYVHAGDALVSIGNLDDKQVVAMISQSDIGDFRAQQGEAVDVHVWGTGTSRVTGRLTTVNPRAQTQIIHPAFSATVGGELDIAAKTASLESGDDQKLELLEPHFMALVELNPQSLTNYRAGHAGFVSFRSQQGSWGSVLVNSLTGWWMDRQQRLRRLW